MKKIIYFAFLFFNMGFSQSLKDRLYPNVCDCFENRFTTSDFDIDLLSSCFDITSKENIKELEEYVRKELDTTSSNLSHESGYEMGEKLSQQIFDDLQEPLVNNCDAYYYFLLEFKKLAFKNMNKGMGRKEADSLRLIVKDGNWSVNTGWQLGAYELGNGNYRQAKKDFLKCLDEEPMNTPSNFFLGMVNEAEGNYDLAIKRYNQVIDQEENPLTFIVKIFLEVAKRKAKG